MNELVKISQPLLHVASDSDLANSDIGVDRAWYLQRHPDVASAGVDPVEHYLRVGWQEGRDPRADFSTSGYLAVNEGVEGNPLLHYLRHGGTKVPPPEWQFAADYAQVSGEDGVDRTWYLQTYVDVARAEVDPVEHYLRAGWRERRDPRPDFSTAAYLDANKELESNPLVHYLRRRQESRDEAAIGELYLLWEKGLFYPKSGQALLPNAKFGSHGVPKLLFAGHEATRTGAPLILLGLMEAFQSSKEQPELYLILERGGPLLEAYKRIAHVLVNHNGLLYRKIATVLDAIAAPAPDLAVCNSADSWRLVEALHAAAVPHRVSLVHERVVHYAPEVWESIHRHSDQVIFSAQAVKDATAAALPAFQDAPVVAQGLLNPAFGRGRRDTARIDVREKLGLSPDTVIVLGCGTRDMRKGIDLFVQLAARVRARTKREVHFIWLGAEQGNSYFFRFIELDISLLNVSSIISMVEEVTDPEPYFLAADAFALTSRDDPFPCVIHEAMACALPIVVFDGAGGAKEAIAEDCGIVVPYLDVDAMAAALAAIAECPTQYASMGRRAESRVRSVYRFSDYAERIRRVCEAVTGQKGSSATGGSDAEYRQDAEQADFEQPSRDALERPQPATDLRARFSMLLGNIGRTIRSEQWWSYKLVPMLAAFYATACMQRTSIAAVWPAAVALLLSMAPCAAYVSLINDLTDRADDSRGGKSNRMAGRPVWQMTLLIATPLCAAAIFSVLWRDDVPLVVAYLGAWAAFSAYSIPPFRLKNRGVLGVIADACGSHVFPTITAAFLAQRAIGGPVDIIWVAALAVWALGCGLRGILWHQLYDFDADRKAAVSTFVQRHSRLTALRVARFALLIESAGLAVLILRIGSIWPIAFLLIYAAFATAKSRLWNVAIVIAEPGDRYAILGQEYYTLLFPLGILFASALRYPTDWIVAAAHCVVFPQPAIGFFRELQLLAGRVLDGIRSPRGDRTAADKHAKPARNDSSDGGDEHAQAAYANSGATTVDLAIAKAAAFLRERLRSGAYGLAAVGSDGTTRFPNDKGHLFVASFLTEAMSGLLDEIDRTIIVTRILAEEQDGAWGYQSPGMLYTDETRPFLVDSDDSAFVLRTLHRLGVNREPQGLMRFYREPERLFVTWDTGTSSGPVALVTEPSLQNNFLAHPEVNANIYLALRGTHFEKYVNYDALLKAQDAAGYWKSYFYPSPLYATLLVLELTRDNQAFAPAIERALTFIAGSQNADGSWGAVSDAYETALALAALAGHQSHAAAINHGVEYLLAAMATDGSWTSRACVWESIWTQDDIWRGYDTHRAFVTARCMIALRRAAGQLD